MGDIHAAHSSISHGVSSDENAKTFAELDQQREAGALAGTPEYDSAEAVKAPVFTFKELPQEDLEKLTKKDLLVYMADWYKNKDIIQAEQLKHAQALATRAAIHGIPLRPRGEPIPMLLEGNPEHPGRQVPYNLMTEDGDPKMTKATKRKPSSHITRTDN